MAPERGAALFEPITRMRTSTLDAMTIIDIIDRHALPVPTTHALCASLFTAMPRTITISMLHNMKLLPNALGALVPERIRRHAAASPVSDVLLCYLQCALPVLGAHRRHTALTVCAVLGQRGSRACTAYVELQLLSAVECSWGDVRRLVKQLSGADIISAPRQAPVAPQFVFPPFRELGQEYMPYPHTDEAHVRLLLGAISAYEAGVPPSAALSPLLAMDYPINGAFLQELFDSPLWMRAADDPAVQTLLGSAPLSALMYVAESLRPDAKMEPHLASVRMGACSALWDVLSPDCAEDMALFSLGAIRALSPHRPAKQGGFMARMGATWGHVARAFCAYVEHAPAMRILLALISTMASKTVYAVKMHPLAALHLRCYLSAEDAANALIHMKHRSEEMCECLVDIVANDGQCALLFQKRFLQRIYEMPPSAVKRFCDSLSPEDWTAIGNVCATILRVDPYLVKAPFWRDVLYVMASAAPNWVKQARGDELLTAAERLRRMRENIPRWHERRLDDLLAVLEPTSFAKRAHM